MGIIEIADFSAAKNPFIINTKRVEVGLVTENSSIYSWYKDNYPEDSENAEIIPKNVTFDNLWNGMNEGIDVYELLGPIQESEILYFVFYRLSMFKGILIQQLYGLQQDAPKLAWKKQLKESGISFRDFYMLRKDWDDLSMEDKNDISQELI